MSLLACLFVTEFKRALNDHSRMTVVYKQSEGPEQGAESSSDEGSESPPDVLLKTLDLFSQLHLIRDIENPSCYGYHLEPSLPSAYSLSDDAYLRGSLDENDRTLVLMGAAIEGLDGEDSETRKQLASCTMKKITPKSGKEDEKLLETQLKIFPQYEGVERAVTAEGVEVEVFWTSIHLNAKWSMPVPLPKPKVEPQISILKMPSALKKGALGSEQKDPSFYSVVPQSKSTPRLQRRPTIYDEKSFEWTQASPGTSFILSSSPENSPLAEFILEVSEQKKALGVKGQILFRDYCGKEWEGVVLTSLGALVYVQDMMGWDNLI